MSELTDQQILLLWRQAELGDPTKSIAVSARPSRLARFAYALGREAGLKEAAAVCDNSRYNFGKDGLCALLADTIRDLSAAPSDSPADVKSAGQTEASQ